MIIVRRYAEEATDLSSGLSLIFAPWIEITYNGTDDKWLENSEGSDEQSGSIDTGLNGQATRGHQPRKTT